ncbi:MAG: hypothetical protein NVS3B3_10760 [Aquirhabdus sp.]
MVVKRHLILICFMLEKYMMNTNLQLIKKIAFILLFASAFAVIGCQKHEDAQEDIADNAAQAAQAATDAAIDAAPLADTASVATATVNNAAVSAPVATS